MDFGKHHVRLLLRECAFALDRRKLARIAEHKESERKKEGETRERIRKEEAEKQARQEAPTAADLAAMRGLVAEGITAGALAVTGSTAALATSGAPPPMVMSPTRTAGPVTRAPGDRAPPG